MSDLMEKLAVSKAIMDKHDNMNRNHSDSGTIPKPELEEFAPVHGSYNIPAELLSEAPKISANPEPPTTEKILKSKLPDEIKRLMLENPIEQKSPLVNSGAVLSDELIEKATRLMGEKKQKPESPPQSKTVAPDISELKSLMREVVEDVLRENGLIIESTTKTNETLVLKVGQHIFEGRITRVKKIK